MKAKNIITALFALILVAFALPAAVADEPSYIIDKVEVNGLEVNGDKTSVEIGDIVKVRVVVQGDENLTEEKEAKVKAWIGGYEYDDIEDTSDTFTINAGVKYPKTLYLELPNNMEAGEYTLWVRVYDGQELVEQSYTLYVEQDRHLLDKDEFDYNIYPGKSMDAGELAEVEVRIENVGKKEEDVKVTLEVPGLGISQKTWISLDSGEAETTEEIEFVIPQNAETGDYELKITAYYSEGHELLELTDVIHVEGAEQVVVDNDDNDNVAEPQDEPEPVEKDVLISLDSTSQSIEQGDEAAYKVSLASFDSKSRAITVKVSGAQLFADARVEPSYLQLEGGQKADVFVYVTMHEDAEKGAHRMMLQVLADGELLEEVQLTAIASEEASMGDVLDDRTLKIAFVVLVVLLIIIGLFIAFRRARHDDFPLEPHDERTYY